MNQSEGEVECQVVMALVGVAQMHSSCKVLVYRVEPLSVFENCLDFSVSPQAEYE